MEFDYVTCELEIKKTFVLKIKEQIFTSKWEVTVKDYS